MHLWSRNGSSLSTGTLAYSVVGSQDDNRNMSHVTPAIDLLPEERPNSLSLNLRNDYAILIGFISIIALVVFLVIIVITFRIQNTRRQRLKKQKKMRPTTIACGGYPSATSGCSALDVQAGTTMMLPTYCLANNGSVATSTMAPKFASMDQNLMDMYAPFSGNMRPGEFFG